MILVKSNMKECGYKKTHIEWVSIKCLKSVFYSGSIASTGQTSAHAPQSVQRSGSIL